MGKPGRPKQDLRLSDSDREELRRLSRRGRANRHLAFRARLILNSGEGATDTAAADGAIIEYGAPEKLLAAFQFKTWLGMQVERRVSPHVALRLAYRFDKQWSNGSLEEDLILRPSFHLITLGVVGRW